MRLDEYFSVNRGYGVLATSDKEAVVNAALYASPHFLDEKTVAFIMADKHTHQNIRQNPSAVYVFKEEGEGYKGKRLYLTRVGESEDQTLISNLRRVSHCWPVTKDCDSEKRFLVSFRIDKVLPLVGDKEER